MCLETSPNIADLIRKQAQLFATEHSGLFESKYAVCLDKLQLVIVRHDAANSQSECRTGSRSILFVKSKHEFGIAKEAAIRTKGKWWEHDIEFSGNFGDFVVELHKQKDRIKAQWVRGLLMNFRSPSPSPYPETSKQFEVVAKLVPGLRVDYCENSTELRLFNEIVASELLEGIARANISPIITRAND